MRAGAGAVGASGAGRAAEAIPASGFLGGDGYAAGPGLPDEAGGERGSALAVGGEWEGGKVGRWEGGRWEGGKVFGGDYLGADGIEVLLLNWMVFLVEA